MNCLPLEPLNIIIRGQMSYQHATEVNTRDKPVYGQEIVFHKYKCITQMVEEKKNFF